MRAFLIAAAVATLVLLGMSADAAELESLGDAFTYVDEAAGIYLS